MSSLFNPTLLQAESYAWWFGIATLLSLIALAILTTMLPRLEEKYEKIAWKIDVGFAWISVSLFFATFWFSNIASDKQDSQVAILEASAAPWKFGDDEKKAFNGVLINAPKCKIETRYTNSDAKRSSDFSNALLDDLGSSGLGYDTSGYSTGFTQTGRSQYVGIGLSAPSNMRADCAEKLQEAFLAIGIKAGIELRSNDDQNYEKDTVVIYIGIKPDGQ